MATVIIPDMVKPYLDMLVALGCKRSTPGEIITRLEAHPLKSIAYNQGKRRADCGHRCDCSGLASCICGAYMDGPGSWGGLSTTTLATYGVLYQITYQEIGPADFLMYGGPGTDGGDGGHVAPVYRRNGIGVTVRDHGSGMGPTERVVTLNSATRWTQQGWRYALASNARPPVLGDREYKRGDFGGVPRDIQGLINVWRAGSLTVDGDLGPVTEGKVREFQKAHGLLVDGKVGPATSKALRAYYETAAPVPTELERVRAELAAAQTALAAMTDVRDKLEARRTAALAALGA